MLDNLRDEVNSQPFFQDESDLTTAETTALPEAQSVRRRGGRFLGMTPIQRFIVSFMLMMIICVLGFMLLLITERIGIYL